jgi:hypothetical protein
MSGLQKTEWRFDKRGLHAAWDRLWIYHRHHYENHYLDNSVTYRGGLWCCSCCNEECPRHMVIGLRLLRMGP